jgi:hypothetical protein
MLMQLPMLMLMQLPNADAAAVLALIRGSG